MEGRIGTGWATTLVFFRRHEALPNGSGTIGTTGDRARNGSGCLLHPLDGRLRICLADFFNFVPVERVGAIDDRLKAAFPSTATITAFPPRDKRGLGREVAFPASRTMKKFRYFYFLF